MKKIISILLLGGLLLTCFAGCAFREQTPEPTEPASKYNNPMDLPEDMLDALTEYLQTINMEFLIGSYSFAERLNYLKNGTQWLHVTFDPSDFYYVCGYYNPDHKNTENKASLDESEDRNYCCASAYTWVKFDSEKDICDTYGNSRIMVAFQINNAQSCRDIAPSTKAVPEFVHYQLYEPEFSDGINIAEPVAFNETFISFTKSEQSTIYYISDIRFHRVRTVPCVCLEEDYYILVELYAEHPDGTRSERDLQREFAEYYDDIMQVMITDKYSVLNENGTVRYYGLIDIEDIANLVEN